MRIKVIITAEIDKQGNILRVIRDLKSCRGGPCIASDALSANVSTAARHIVGLSFDLERMKPGTRREVGA
jgi:hypothetical protein